jgi:mannose-6-phosphate isomerase
MRLSVHIRTYAFGERLIPERLGKGGLPAGRVAETWEVSDHRDARATVAEGPFAGLAFHDVVMARPDEVVGAGWRGPHFPMLAKFLDASHMLPVHLHADDEAASRLHGEPNGKTEAWHILWAAPGASILAGVKPGVSREELIAAFKAQDYARVMPGFPIQAGDTVYVPGGVLHSFGPDTMIFEIQQTSDLTQHVMPHDIYGNPLSEEEWDRNIAATLAELKTGFQPAPHGGLARREDANRFAVGGAGPHFALERWTLTRPHREEVRPDRGLTVSNLGDEVEVATPGGAVTLARGESCVVPAAAEEVTVTPRTTADLIVCYLPDLERDVIGPLRAAGHAEPAIAALGETGLARG